DHLARAHRAQDRAPLHRAHGLGEGRLARGGRGAVARLARAARAVRGRQRGRLRRDPPAPPQPRRRQAPGAAGEGARPALRRRLGRLRAAGAAPARPARARRLPAPGAGGHDRLDAVLPRLGAGRPLPGDPRGSGGGRRGARALPRRARDARHHRPRALADRAGRVRPVPRARGRRRRRAGGGAGGDGDRALPAPAGGQAGRAPRLLPRRLHRPRRDRPARLDGHVRGDRRHRHRAAPGALPRRQRRLPRDPVESAGRPPGRGLRRAPAPARAHGVLGLRAGRGARQRGPDRRGLPRHPPGARLPGLPRPQPEGAAVPGARRPRERRDDAHPRLRDAADGGRVRLLLQPPGRQVLRGRARGQGPGGGLRPAPGRVPGRGRALAGVQPRLRSRVGTHGGGPMARHPDRTTAAPVVRLSSFYFTYYAALGAFTPYWALHLESRGMGITAISVMMSLWYATRVVAPSAWASPAAASPRPIRWLRIGCVLTLASFACFLPAQPAWTLFAAMVAFCFFYNAVMPQFEAIMLGHLGADAHRYGAIRVWGSIGFILVTTGFGWLIEHRGAAIL